MLIFLLPFSAFSSEIDATAGLDLRAGNALAVLAKGDLGVAFDGLPPGLGFWGDVALGPVFRRTCRGISGCKHSEFAAVLLVGPRYSFGAVGPVDVYADAGIGPYLSRQSFGSGSTSLNADLDVQLGGGVRVPLGDLTLDFDVEGHLLDGRYPSIELGGGMVFEIGGGSTSREARARKKKRRTDANNDKRFIKGTKDWFDWEERVLVTDHLAQVPPELRASPAGLTFRRVERAGLGTPAVYQDGGVVFADDWLNSTPDKRQRVLNHELAHRWGDLNVALLNGFAGIGWDTGGKTWTFEELNRSRAKAPGATFPTRFKGDIHSARNPGEDFGVSVEMYIADPKGFAKAFPTRAAWISKNVFPPAPKPAPKPPPAPAPK